MKHDFNHKAETFDSPKNIFLANLVYHTIEQQLDFLSDKEILDFGGGTGLLALPLAKQAKSVTLVDISEKMLEQARLKAEQQAIKNIQFMEQDLLENPLKQEFDIIIVSRVLYHIDLDAALSLFHQHLKEDGRLLIADFTKAEANYHGFELTELENKIIEHGFSSVHSQILYSAEDLFQGNYSELFLTVAQKSLA